jgi:hypothetical protein
LGLVLLKAYFLYGFACGESYKLKTGEYKMDKYIINENPSANGVHELHNATLGCEALPDVSEQIAFGYFANYELAYKRAQMNWPTVKIKGCQHCCVAAKT